MSSVYNRWQDWPLAAKGGAIVALPMMLLIATMYSSYLSQREISRADSEVSRTLTVQTDIQALHTLIAEAASSVRGYLLTGQEEFLSPFWHAQDRLPKTLADLRRDVKDPIQIERLNQASDLVSAKLESLSTLRTQGPYYERAALQSHLTHSKKILDELRGQISLLRDRETELLVERSDIARQAKRRDAWLGLTTASVAVAGSALALWMLLTGIVRRVQKVAANAERLVNGQPLLPAPLARDEVGQLALRLQAASVLLAERADQSQAASRAKTEFLSRTSHELRTPLNAILGFAQLLEAELKTPPLSTSVAQVLSAGRHLLTLIDDVLDIARIEAGQIKLALEPVALHPLLYQAYTLIQPLAAQHRVTLELEHSLQVPKDAHVLADRQRLRQVLLNLLSNAVKYNRDMGRVWVSVVQSNDQQQMQITVHDTGVGISQDKAQRLFEPFERLDAERLSVEGTGLGLAISKQLMQRMQGGIEVQSTPNSGSAFTLTLKCAPAAHSDLDEAAPMLSPTTADVETKHLLCVEDNPSNLALIEAILSKRSKWQVKFATNGAQALQLASEVHFDLVLLDLHLPDISGVDVLLALRQQDKDNNLPIVILSADAVPETISRLQAAGASQYLTKPLDVQKIYALLDSLERRSGSHAS